MIATFLPDPDSAIVRAPDRMSGNNGGLHCPIDDAPLAMTERASIEIDYRPTCRGVSPDRGEPDKIVARSAPDVGEDVRHASDPEFRRDDPRHHAGPRGQCRGVGGHGGQGHVQPKRRQSFLEEVFD